MEGNRILRFFYFNINPAKPLFVRACMRKVVLSLNEVLTINSPFSSVVVVAIMFCLGANNTIGPFFYIPSEETFNTPTDSLSFLNIISEVQ